MNADRHPARRAPGAPSAELTARIIRAFYEVHWELGHAYMEAVYVRALRIALADLGVAAEAEAPIPVRFRGRTIGRFRADLLVEGLVIVEVKAVRELDAHHTAQLLNYLRASDVEIGLLLNFGSRATFKRFAFGNSRKRSLRSSAYICGPPTARDPRLDAPPPPSRR